MTKNLKQDKIENVNNIFKELMECYGAVRHVEVDSRGFLRLLFGNAEESFAIVQAVSCEDGYDSHAYLKFIFSPAVISLSED